MKGFTFVISALVLMVVCAGLSIQQDLRAGEPKLTPRTEEFRKTDADTTKPEPMADKEDLKDVAITKLSNQVYRVDVKITAEGLKEYEAALVKFSKDHPSVHPSPAPRDPKGNVGETVYYWNVNEK
ncbi:MAG: hypothetical protein Q8L24_02460 [bacterium]|nr:hypothetical protein [bacterium]